MSGNTRGISGADFSCYKQAKRHGYHGTFKALLTSRVQDLTSIVQASDRTLPIVNTQGDLLFDTFSSIFKGPTLKTTRIYSFNGRNVCTDHLWPLKLVWHGSTAHGTRAEHSNCNTWRTNSTNSLGTASRLLGGNLVEQHQQPCDKSLIVLCIEVVSKSSMRAKRDLDSDFKDESEYQKYLETMRQ